MFKNNYDKDDIYQVKKSENNKLQTSNINNKISKNNMFIVNYNNKNDYCAVSPWAGPLMLFK
jgi:hypothetical protein